MDIDWTDIGPLVVVAGLVITSFWRLSNRIDLQGQELREAIALQGRELNCRMNHLDAKIGGLKDDHAGLSVCLG